MSAREFMGEYPQERTHPAWTPRSMSERNTMSVRMREFILATTAGVSGAAALVQTAIFWPSPAGWEHEAELRKLNYQPTGITKVRDCIIM